MCVRGGWTATQDTPPRSVGAVLSPRSPLCSHHDHFSDRLLTEGRTTIGSCGWPCRPAPIDLVARKPRTDATHQSPIRLAMLATWLIWAVSLPG